RSCAGGRGRASRGEVGRGPGSARAAAAGGAGAGPEAVAPPPARSLDEPGATGRDVARRLGPVRGAGPRRPVAVARPRARPGAGARRGARAADGRGPWDPDGARAARLDGLGTSKGAAAAPRALGRLTRSR